MKKIFSWIIIITFLIVSCFYPYTNAQANCLKGPAPLTSIENIQDLKNAAKSNGGFYGVSKNIIIDEKVYLTGTSQNEVAICSKPYTKNSGIYVKNGGTLVVDSSSINLFGNGNDPFIQVEKGGTLILIKGQVSVPLISLQKYSSVEIFQDGKCLLYDTFNVNVLDRPFTDALKGSFTKVSSPVTPPKPILPLPENKKISCEIVQVRPTNKVNIFITVPPFNDNLTSMVVQTKEKGTWKNQGEYFRDYENSSSDIFFYENIGLHNDNKSYEAWMNYQTHQGFIHYAEYWTKEKANKTIPLRVILKYKDNTKVETSEISFTMPSKGSPTDFNVDPKYGFLDGSRGGLGKLENNRIPPTNENNKNPNKKPHGDSSSNLENHTNVPGDNPLDNNSNGTLDNNSGNNTDSNSKNQNISNPNSTVNDNENSNTLLDSTPDSSQKILPSYIIAILCILAFSIVVLLVVNIIGKRRNKK